jgi:PAS domain S-box-containing protein
MRGGRVRLAEGIFESLNDGVTVADCSLPDMPLIYVNRAFEKLTGYAADEVLGKNCRFLHATDTEQDSLAYVRSSLKKGTTCTAVLRNYRKDGSLFYNELRLSPLPGEDGKPAFYIGIQRDVSDRVYAEEALWRLNDDLVRINRELNVANERLSELLYVAAHDIKSPVTSLMLSLDLLQEHQRDLRGPEFRRRIHRLSAMAHHVRDIVIDVLEARRVEWSDVKPDLEPLDLVLKTRTVQRFYRDVARAKGITMLLRSNRPLPAALGDRNWTLVVVDNLISNALKYSPRGSAVELNVSAKGGMVCLEVRDHGPGIRADEIADLFGRFVRLSAEPTGDEHSTGLGLYIAKRYTDRMKGTLRCESTEGQGATFILELPAVSRQTGRRRRSRLSSEK